jgi:hypothetical protein
MTFTPRLQRAEGSHHHGERSDRAKALIGFVLRTTTAGRLEVQPFLF